MTLRFLGCVPVNERCRRWSKTEHLLNRGLGLCACVHIGGGRGWDMYAVRQPFSREGMFFVCAAGGSKILQGMG